MKVNIRKPTLLIHIPMHFKKTIQFKTIKVNIKETSTKRARLCHYQSRHIYAPPDFVLHIQN